MTRFGYRGGEEQHHRLMERQELLLGGLVATADFARC
jgi:hypothetical protein